MVDIQHLLETIQHNQQPWLRTVRLVLAQFLPEEDVAEIPIYPIIGYDMGIDWAAPYL